MKKYATYSAILMAIMGVYSATACYVPPPCLTCPDGSALIEVDFDDYWAGTLVGGSKDWQRFETGHSANTNSSIADNQGFSIDVGGGSGYATLYDTDKRKYYDERNGSYYRTTNYDDVDYRSSRTTSSGNDDDLEYSWDGGNMDNQRLGNALIIQTTATYNEKNQGHMDKVQGTGSHAPNDHGGGGYITFNFESALSGFGFTFADLDSGEKGSITFFDTDSSETVTVNLSEFESGGSDQNRFANRGSNNQSGNVVWEDGYANKIDLITVSELNTAMGSSISNIGAVKFNFTSSGGIAGIHYCAVPEPSTYFAGAGLLFLIGLHFHRNRKRIK